MKKHKHHNRMALINDKFAEVKSEIQNFNFEGAVNECDNGINNECVNAKVDLENIKNKLIDKFGEDDLMSVDLEGVITNYFG